jgi:type II secretory pathway pseudopilin PulG
VETGGSIDTRAGERGETLLEMLITIILVGTAVIGILAGLVAVTNLASRNSQVTHVRNTAQSYAEMLKQPVDAFEYVPCALAPTPTTPGTYPDIDASLLPAGYTAVIKEIHHATLIPNGSPSQNVSWTAGLPTSCPTSDQGLQRLVVEVQVTSGGPTRAATVTVIKRDARCSGTYQNVDQGPC